MPEVGHDGQLVRTAEEDVHAPGERPKHGRGGLVRPQASPQIDVEAHRHPGGPCVIDRAIDRGCGIGRQGGRDAGQVQPAALEGAGVGRSVYVRGRQPRAGGSGAGIDDVGGSQAAPLAEHQPGGRIGVRRQRRALDPLAEKTTADRVSEPVRPDPSDEPHRMTETCQPDCHVRLGARDEPLECRGLGERAGRDGDESDEALAEGHDVGHAVTRRGLHARRRRRRRLGRPARGRRPPLHRRAASRPSPPRRLPPR